MRRILIVEDEQAIADVVEYALRSAGYATSCAVGVAEARRRMADDGADLVVLDLGLPDGDGLVLCAELQRTSRVPVLMLTCRDEESDRVRGLETGADDYMTKPFSPRELVARVRAILRRVGAAAGTGPADTLRLGRVSLCPVQHRVLLDHTEVYLTPMEFGILEHLLAAPKRVFSRDALIDRVWGDEGFISDRTVDSHVKGIRRKFARLDPEADPIETVFGVGYRARVC